jgi:dipeptidyl aminopeptidase/acylaminoacyl peptidase
MGSRARAIGVAALALLLGCAAGCGGGAGREPERRDGLIDLGEGTNPQWTDRGRIVFSDGTGVWEIEPDGGGLRRIVDSEAGTGLVVSPDRRSMLIPAGPTNLVGSIDGSGLRPVADVQASSTARWSDDGSMISFQRSDGGGQSIWAVPAAGGEPRRLFAHFGGFVLAWAKDGRMVVRAFETRADGSFLATLLVVPGHPPRQLPVMLEEARFLPNGSIEAVETQGGLVALDREGRLIGPIDSPTPTTELPDRSPDGDLVAFSGDDGVWVTGPDGRDARRLTAERCRGATFSPDGRHLLCRYVKVVGIDDEGDPAHELHIGLIEVSPR